nr:MAG TPA: hypothetical protein [Caudoviricetes sp.]
MNNVEKICKEGRRCSLIVFDVSLFFTCVSAKKCVKI